MADYIAIPGTSEKQSEDNPSFQSICKLWAKSDHWPLEDAVRLLLNQNPKVFSKSSKNEADPKSFNIILDIAQNCLGHSLTAIKNPHSERRLNVDPREFVAWAKKKDFAVPAELDLALNSLSPKRLDKYGSRLRQRKSNHRERVRAIAALLWGKSPEIEISEMINRSEILEYGCEGCPYAESVLESWVADLPRKV